MPFNAAIVGVGVKVFRLSIPVEDLSSTFDVEAEVLAQYGVPTRVGSRIELTVDATNVVAATTAGYAIDADAVDDAAALEIILSGGVLHGRGGAGGDGGLGDLEVNGGSSDNSEDGDPGLDGGLALRCGCPTTITGTGTVTKGYGGGGGGGGSPFPPDDGEGGGGGGGGAPLGLGGSGGQGVGGPNGPDGDTATVLLLGLGGAPTGFSGEGGNGGDENVAALPGGDGSQTGGIAGIDGDAIDTQGFAFIVDPGIVIVGATI